jgi:hypothetical protein
MAKAPPLRLEPSKRKDKKWAAIFGDGQKVHFGGKGCGDYTIYSRGKNRAFADKKRMQYIARHGATEKEAWRNPRTPASLSRYLLWETPTLKGAVTKFVKKFKLV